MSVDYERRGRVAVITIERPDVRNAIDRATASALGDAWRTFERDSRVDVGVLYGAGGHFSAGADLHAFDLVDSPAGYLGFTRMEVSKPTIAAVEGYCVAGGFEMALWCDLRVAGATAVFGCLERRFGVPLVDGGTVRLPQVVGLGVALELILTGREVGADEAQVIGLVNVVVAEGASLDRAVELGQAISAYPQTTVRSDRAAVRGALGLGMRDALEHERRMGATVMDTAAAGADRFSGGAGRSGTSLTGPAAPDTSPVEPVSATPAVATSPVAQDPQPEEVPLVRLPRAGRGRPVMVLTTNAERAWRDPVESMLVGMGYVTYPVRVTEDPEADAGTLAEAAAAVLAVPEVIGERLGLVALGRAVGAALDFSTVDRRVAAVVEFSGRRSAPPPSFRLATASYLGHHGSADEGTGTIAPFEMEVMLRDMGIDATFHSYRGAEADFFVPGAAGHHDVYTSVAWDRTRLFLERTI